MKVYPIYPLGFVVLVAVNLNFFYLYIFLFLYFRPTALASVEW